MRIEIDEEKCCGSGQCVLAAPELFDQREGDGIVVLLNPAPFDHQEAGARTAMQRCPAVAIRLVDE